MERTIRPSADSLPSEAAMAAAITDTSSVSSQASSAGAAAGAGAGTSSLNPNRVSISNALYDLC